MKRYLAMVAASLCLATIGVFVKLIGDGVPILTVLFFRFLFGFILIAVAAPFLDNTFLQVKRRDLLKYAFLGLMITVCFGLYMTAYTLAPISNVMLVSATFPIFVAIFSYFILRERTDKASMISFLLAFLGLMIINPFRPEYLAGSLLSLANAVVYGIVVAFMRLIDERKRIGVVFWFIGFAVLFTLPFPLVFGLGDIQAALPWLLLLGLLPTGLAYLLINYTLEKMPAEISSLIILTIEPFAAILMAIVIIGETISPYIVLGGILIVGGGIFLEIKDRLLQRY